MGSSHGNKTNTQPASGKAKSNKHRIRELEAEVKELEMAGADADDVDDGGSSQGNYASVIENGQKIRPKRPD